MFFDDITYPSQWEHLSDKALANQYRKRCRKNPNDSRAQLIICYLMKKHKAGILLVSRKYMKDFSEIEEFSHDLFLKLVVTLKKERIRKNFGGLLLKVVTRMQLDIIRKNQKRNIFVKTNETPDIPSANTVSRTLDISHDYPISKEKLDQLLANKKISSLENFVGKKTLNGDKPGEIATESTNEELEIKAHKIKLDQNDNYQQKLDRVNRALERLRRKLKRIYGKGKS